MTFVSRSHERMAVLARAICLHLGSPCLGLVGGMQDTREKESWAVKNPMRRLLREEDGSGDLSLSQADHPAKKWDEAPFSGEAPIG